MDVFSIFRKGRESNVAAVCTFLLNKLGVKYTRYHLENLLQDHIDYPSLLSVKDTLSEYGIESVAMRKGNRTRDGKDGTCKYYMGIYGCVPN